MLFRMLIIAVAVWAGANAPAAASLQLTLFAPGNATQLVLDGGAFDSDPNQGAIQVANVTVGGYVFNLAAANTSTTGMLTVSSYSVGSITGTTDGKVGVLVSLNNAPAIGTAERVISNVAVSYLGSATGSSANVEYAAFVDPTNSLSTVSYVGGVVTVVPGGTLVDRAVTTLATAGGPTSWTYSRHAIHAGLHAINVAVNLLVMADMTSSGSAVHAFQLSGQANYMGHVIPEPSSLGVWALVTVAPWSLGRRGRRR